MSVDRRLVKSARGAEAGCKFRIAEVFRMLKLQNELWPANLLAHQRDPAGIDIILSQELPDVSRIVRRGQARITPAVALIERIQLFKHLPLQVRQTWTYLRLVNGIRQRLDQRRFRSQVVGDGQDITLPDMKRHDVVLELATRGFIGIVRPQNSEKRRGQFADEIKFTGNHSFLLRTTPTGLHTQQN